MLIDLKTFLSQNGLTIDKVLHVGAHECEERTVYNSVGVSDDNIVWVDANSDLVSKMKETLPIPDRIHHLVVSDVDNEEVDFNITNNFQSSSILPLGTHKTSYPHISVVQQRKLLTSRLDTWINSNLKVREIFTPSEGSSAGKSPGGVSLINLDIQGVELRALKGLGSYLSSFKIIYTEVNTEHVYEGCDLLEDMDSYLEEQGFVRVEIRMEKQNWGDAIYLHKSLLPNNEDIYVAAAISGGLGNQLFQLANLLAYCKKHGYNPIYDTSKVSELHDTNQVWNRLEMIRSVIPEGRLEEHGTYKVYSEDNSKYTEIPPTRCNLLLQGYYQSDMYFSEGLGPSGHLEIKEIFQRAFMRLADELGMTSKDFVGVHVRRGDYLNLQQVFFNHSVEYYLKAIQCLPDDVRLMVVSEDIEWCKKNLPAHSYVSGDLYSDFINLMLCTQGNIIGNSTFSWWAAYLNPFEGKTVYPFEWFTEARLIKFHRYHVKGWTAISIQPNSNINNIVYNNLNQDREYSLKITRSILGDDFTKRPVGWSTSDYITFLNNAIVVAWTSGEKDKCREMGHIMSELVYKETQGNITQTTFNNMKFVLGDSFYTRIDLRTIPIYIICRPQRRDEMHRRFTEHGMTPTFIDAVIRPDPTDGCREAHLKALKHALTEDKFPCAIFEDDIKFLDSFGVNIQIPVFTHAFYLGVSRYALIENTVTAKKDKVTVRKFEPYYQVRNMLSAHAILHVKREWTETCYKYTKGCKYFNLPCDLAQAKLQGSTFVFAPNNPLVVQDRELNGQEDETTVSLERYV